jgi:hypothetical protein
MRPILAFAILLLGLTAALSEVKFGTIAAVQTQSAKMQDRVPAVDEAQPSDVETTGSIGKYEIGDGATRVAEVSVADVLRSRMSLPETGTPEIKKTDNALALLTPPTVEPSDAVNESPPAADDANLDSEADTSVAESIDALCNAVMASAQDNDLPVQFFANLIWQESRLQRDSISKAGALGIAQFMPEAAQEVGLGDPFDPREAIPASARLLKALRQHFGNLGYVAAAYNAGAGRVGRWLDHHRSLPRETRTYVLRVTGRTAEAWRKSQLADSKLRFTSSLPCRNLPAFAELEQAQLKEAQQSNDGKDAQPQQQEKIATRVAHLIARKVAIKPVQLAEAQQTDGGKDARQQEKVAARVAHLIARKVAVKVVGKQAAKAAAKAAEPVTTVGSVMLPLTAEGKDATAKAAGAAQSKMLKTKVAAKTAAQPIIAANSGSMALPLVAEAKAGPKPATAAAAHAIAPIVQPRRDALHRPPVPHEKRRVASAA